MKIMLQLIVVLAMLSTGCWSSWGAPRHPYGAIMGKGKGPLAVHVKTLSEDGSGDVVWERTLMAWPAAPVFLSSGREFVLRLWAVSESDGAFIYTEAGGLMEIAQPPAGTPLKFLRFGETFNLKGQGEVYFLVTVDRL